MMMVFLMLVQSFSLNLVSDQKKPEEILKDVSMLCLGSNSDLTSAERAGYLTGLLLKKNNGKYFVFGSLDTLNSLNDDYFKHVNKSPYITAYVLDGYAEGLSSAGIVPVIDGRGRVNDDVIKSLASKKAFYPVLVDDQKKADYISYLGYRTVFYYETMPDDFKFPFDGDDLLLPDARSIDIEKERIGIIENSTIYLNDSGNIYVKKVFKNDGIVVFSNDKLVMDYAKNIASGKEFAYGRIPW